MRDMVSNDESSPEMERLDNALDLEDRPGHTEGRRSFFPGPRARSKVSRLLGRESRTAPPFPAGPTPPGTTPPGSRAQADPPPPRAWLRASAGRHRPAGPAIAACGWSPRTGRGRAAATSSSAWCRGRASRGRGDQLGRTSPWRSSSTHPQRGSPTGRWWSPITSTGAPSSSLRSCGRRRCPRGDPWRLGRDLGSGS